MIILNPKTVSDYNSLSRSVALVTFLLGSLIVSLYYFTAYNGVIYISFLFMVSFFVLNSLLFFSLIYLFFKNKNDRKAILISLLLMFMNIPIGYFYLQIGFTIYGHLNS
jgi:hypothetical protein